MLRMVRDGGEDNMGDKINWEVQVTAQVRGDENLGQDGGFWDREDGHLRWQDSVTAWVWGGSQREGHSEGQGSGAGDCMDCDAATQHRSGRK